jgi:hypothetical protein
MFPYIFRVSNLFSILINTILGVTATIVASGEGNVYDHKISPFDAIR